MSRATRKNGRVGAADLGPFVQAFRPATTYAAGQSAALPNGDVGTAKVAFTSGATFDPANWDIPAGPTRVVTGPTLPSMPAGTEYVWNKTDGAGVLLDIMSGVA